MNQQTNGTPELKYSEETFRDMYEALKALTFQFAMAVSNPYSAEKRVYTQANEALAKAEGKQ